MAAGLERFRPGRLVGRLLAGVEIVRRALESDGIMDRFPQARGFSPSRNLATLRQHVVQFGIGVRVGAVVLVC